ncbi:hypothetical protein R3I93_017499 [Phoxinus phoxinus]|uniref:Uncharacterized protein n=1 Tax=Phoxinus phoxinus TaxID=58324 RepID=A0AAN9GZ07_9TELE
MTAHFKAQTVSRQVSTLLPAIAAHF